MANGTMGQCDIGQRGMMTPEELELFENIKKVWELSVECGVGVMTKLSDDELGFLINKIERLQSENDYLRNEITLVINRYVDGTYIPH